MLPCIRSTHFFRLNCRAWRLKVTGISMKHMEQCADTDGLLVVGKIEQFDGLQ